MTPIFAAVVFSTWQAVFLIALCFGSLAASLYCIFFMVPLRSFMKHVNSLGGGMQGIRAHVEGVREEIDERLNTLEKSLYDALEEHNKTLSDSVATIRNMARENADKLETIHDSTKAMKQSLGETDENVDELERELTDLRSQQASLNSNLQALEEKMEGAVEKTVHHAYSNLEGSVLGALEALQDEILRPTMGDDSSHQHGAGSSGHYRSHSGRSSTHYTDKIIPAEPLFADVDEPEDRNGDDEGDDSETDPSDD